jgi:hypothetical protein
MQAWVDLISFPFSSGAIHMIIHMNLRNAASRAARCCLSAVAMGGLRPALEELRRPPRPHQQAEV